MIPPFRLERCVHRSALGVVWAARDPRGRALAVKEVPRPDLLAREITALQRVRSLCDVQRLVDSGEGWVATAWVEDVFPGCWRDAVRALAAAAAALASVHEVGVVHSDIKPSNVRAPWLIDFGAAVLPSGPFSSPVASTPEYRLPDEPPGTREHDVFALGVTAFECLTGQRVVMPDRSLGQRKAAAAVRWAATALPLELGPNVPLALGRAVRRATDRDPAVRPEAGELAWELANAAGSAWKQPCRLAAETAVREATRCASAFVASSRV